MPRHSIQLSRLSRPLLTTAAAAALLLSLSIVTGSPAGAKPHAHKHTRVHKHSKRHKRAKARKATAPLSGIYEACSYPDPGAPRSVPDCSDRLAVLRQGGFRSVLNYSTASMSIDDKLRYADQAQRLGMKVIWNLNTEALSLDEKLDIVRTTSSLPATWGYYIGDEHPEDLPQVAELSRTVRTITDRPLLYVSRPNPSKLRPFKGLADYIGPDSYPVGPFDQPTCQTARWASKMVKRNLTMVLQAFSWSMDYPNLAPQWPSAGQMRRMRKQAMRCGRPKLLLWFCFHCIINEHPNPDSYWRELAWAANDVSLESSFRLPSANGPPAV